MWCSATLEKYSRWQSCAPVHSALLWPLLMQNLPHCKLSLRSILLILQRLAQWSHHFMQYKLNHYLFAKNTWRSISTVSGQPRFYLENGCYNSVHIVQNLIKLKFGFLFKSADVAHCEAMPQICPAEHLAMEVRENSSFRLRPQTSRQHRSAHKTDTAS